MSERDKFQSVRGLNLPAGQYAITGSGPLGIRGLRSIGDIDILVTPELWESLSRKYGITDEHGVKKIAFPNTDIEALGEESFYTLPKETEDPSVQDRIAQAEIIDGLPFETLEHVIYYKQKMGRPKDLRDIRLIRSIKT